MKTALITGAARGIGRATATIFSKAGWRVIAIDNRAMRRGSARLTCLRGDVSDAAATQALFQEVTTITNNVDALVNCAAVQVCKPILEMTVQEWDLVMATNVRSAFLMIRGAHGLLRKPGGAIVNVSSVHALATSENISAYAASKGALLALTRALALELAGVGIRVNAVLPGAVDTPMLRQGLHRGHLQGATIQNMMDSLSRKTPLKRVGRPEEIARSILFLADGRQSSFITGEGLTIDGGVLARLSSE